MQLGLGGIFNSSADLSGILNDDSSSQIPLVVSQVTQKAMIDVNEEGSKAAAATG